MASAVLATAASSWAVLMGIAPVLQIRRMLRARSSDEVSVGYFMVLLTGATTVTVAFRLRGRPPRKTPPPRDQVRE